jgi:hypothetical protein
MFPLTMTIHTLAQLSAVMRALQSDLKAPDADDGAQPEVAAAPGPKPPVPAPTQAASPAPGRHTATAAAAPQAAAPEKMANASDPGVASVAAQPPALTAAADRVTYPQVAAAITHAVRVSRERTVDTLSAFGARKGPDLKPEQFGPFLAALAQALEGVAA